MAWDANGAFSISRRVGGRVIREYFGGGVAGLLAERFFRREQERREQEAQAVRKQLREAQAAAEAIEAGLAPLDALADLLVRGAMLASGHHRTGRKWRSTKRGRPKKITA